MKIKFIEAIKQILKKLKIRSLPDEKLEHHVNQMIENDEVEGLKFYMKSFGNRQNQKEAAKSVMEADISLKAKKDVIDTLPHSTKKELFKQSIKTKEIIAQKDKETFLKIILNDPNLNPYNELYYRLDKAFSDSELQRALDKIYEKRNENAVFLIEEPEINLHPGYQRKLINILQLEIFNKHQYFITTHSNHLIDSCFDYDNISIYKFINITIVINYIVD